LPVATMCIEDDHVLVSRYQQGEAAVFDELYARHIDRVYNIAHRLVGNPETAQDICQEAFVRVYKNLGRFRFEAKFTTWLYTIVLNLARSHHRKKRNEPFDELPANLSGSDGRDMINNVALKEKKRAVKRKVKDLPPREREALVLRHYEGLSCNEAAEIMDCAPETIRTLSFFAVRKLREALKEEGYEV
jgi:RNA polymerase sigma-70 factor (ECF subfamily)